MLTEKLQQISEFGLRGFWPLLSYALQSVKAEQEEHSSSAGSGLPPLPGVPCPHLYCAKGNFPSCTVCEEKNASFKKKISIYTHDKGVTENQQKWNKILEMNLQTSEHHDQFWGFFYYRVMSGIGRKGGGQREVHGAMI